MNEEMIENRKNQLRMTEDYNKIQREEDDDSLAEYIFYTRKALDEGYLPSGFEESEKLNLEILLLVQADRNIQKTKTKGNHL